MELTVPRRYCGPPSSGNGGWTSGALASHVRAVHDGPAVSVRLSSPPPLDRPMAVVADHPEPLTGVPALRLYDGEVLVATGTPVAELDEPVPPPATPEEAERAQTRYEGDEDHPFASCYSCGTDRSDGLGLRPGPLMDGSGRYATPWTVPDEVGRAVTWAALDCPSGWAAGVAGRAMVLGTMTARVWRVPSPGERLVVTAWKRGEQGRRTRSASTVHTAAGEMVGRAETVWIAVDPSSVRPAVSS